MSLTPVLTIPQSNCFRVRFNTKPRAGGIWAFPLALVIAPTCNRENGVSLTPVLTIPKSNCFRVSFNTKTRAGGKLAFPLSLVFAPTFKRENGRVLYTRSDDSNVELFSC